MPGGASLALYRGLTGVLAPAIPALLQNRIRRGKEDPRRIGERRGIASLPRPQGTLIWIHAASVGESLAVLPLANHLLGKPDRSVLVTTGTVTSAELMQQRLPPRAFHQYVPLDLRGNVVRFLNHWRPDLALFVESELWPNLLLETRQRDIPLALVNARLSAKSFEGWKRAPGLARRMFGSFDLCLAQDEAIARRISALGGRDVRVAGNLKADAPPLPVDEPTLLALRNSISGRHVFLAASTHEGEDESVFAAAAVIRQSGALTIIVPRHIERGEILQSLAAAHGFVCTRRQSGALPSSATEIYLADTMGELGLFYRVAQVAFLGGSLVPHGGQNPLEAARLCVPVLAGPHTGNFEDVYRALFTAQGFGRIASVDELAGIAMRLLENSAEAAHIGEQAKAAADRLGGALARTLEASERLLANART
jgi:3-deoxy-D-manno-octulosonic-acid transferase